MGNYLTSVAAKLQPGGQERAASLHPRIPSLFEPPLAALSARFTPTPRLRFDPDARAGVDRVTSALYLQFGSRLRAQEPENQDPAAYPIAKPLSNQPPANPLPIAQAKTVSVAFEPRTPVREIEAPPTIPPFRPTARIRSAALLKPESPESDATIAEPKKAAFRMLMRDPESSEVGSPSEQRKLAKHDVDRMVEHKAALGESRNESLTRPHQPVASDSQATAIPGWSRSQHIPPEATSDPSVNVVIGRVVVQAIHPPPPPLRVAPAPPTPMLTLEQYLKQRGGY
jgi:hypothetical protein